MKFYQRIGMQMPIEGGIEQGWCVPPVCEIARIPALDLTGITMSGGDFNETQLSEAIAQDAVLNRICLVTREKQHGQTVVFLPSVATAQAAATVMATQYGLKAGVVYGKQDEEERRGIIADFRAGKLTVLVNCQVVAMGFDVPTVTTLILARPTRSRSFWLQCIGRATRPLRGTVDFLGSTPESRRAAIAASQKPCFRIIDMTDCSLDHRLITAVDMFCVAPKEVLTRAKALAAAVPEPATPDELLAEALAQIKAEEAAKAIEARRLRMSGQATGTVITTAVDLRATGKRCVGTYHNPLRGRYTGCILSELPIHYVQWAAQNGKLTPWIRTMFRREEVRRNARR